MTLIVYVLERKACIW